MSNSNKQNKSGEIIGAGLLSHVPTIMLPKEIQDVSIERTRKAISASGHRPIGQFEWPALLRKLNRENPGYDN